MTLVAFALPLRSSLRVGPILVLGLLAVGGCHLLPGRDEAKPEGEAPATPSSDATKVEAKAEAKAPRTEEPDAKREVVPAKPPEPTPSVAPAKPPVEVVELTRQGQSGLNLDYRLRVAEAPAGGASLTIKAACRVGSKTLVDVRHELVSPSPAAADGLVQRTYAMFQGSGSSISGQPEQCDVTTWRRSKPEAAGAPEEILLDESCLRSGAIAKGRCDPAAPAPPAPAPLTVDAIALGEVKLALLPPFGASDALELQIEAEVTARRPVDRDDWITAEASCTGRDASVRDSVALIGPALRYLGPDETVWLSVRAFRSQAFGGQGLAKPPKRCRVELFGGPSSGPKREEGYGAATESSTSASAVLLGTYCLEKGAVTPC